MSRTNRIAFLLALVLLVVAAGTVLATRAPVARDEPAPPASSHEAEADEESPPAAEDLANARARLEAAEIPFDDAALDDLASRYGLGGAIRVLAWSAETDTEVSVITGMRDGTETEPGMGWGRIAREPDVKPGIGWIMGNGGGNGNGHGRDSAPGQVKASPEE